MIKRYEFKLDKYGEPHKWEDEANEGEYVKYSDIAPLLDWLKERANSWQKEVASFTGDYSFDDGYESGCFRCGDELESKLREFIGEE